MVNGAMAAKKTARREKLAQAMQRLAEAGVRMTPQRAAILEWIFNSDAHFSAEDLWCTMRTGGRVVSRATIYRFLSLLLQLGILRELPLGDPHVHYEVALGDETHEHIVCTVCGKVVEFRRPDIEAAIKEVCRQYGFECRAHRFEILGICSACQKSRARREKRSKTAQER